MDTKITVSRNKLERALQVVGAAAAGQSTVPICCMVLFSFSKESGIILRATDNNTYIEGAVEVIAGEGRAEVAVDPKRLAAVLANLGREEIEIGVEDGGTALKFAAGRQKATLPGLDGEDFIDLPKIAPIHRFVLPASTMREAIKRTSHATLKKSDTQADRRWNCLCVSAEAGCLRVLASDSHRFAQVLIAADQYQHTPANVPEEGKKQRGEILHNRTPDAAMIPFPEVAKIARVLDAAGSEPLTVEIGWRMVALTAGKCRAVLPIWDEVAFAKGVMNLIDARRAQGFKSEVVIGRDELARTLRAAKAALPTAGLFEETHEGICLALWPGENGPEVRISTGWRGSSYYSDSLPAEIDLADHFNLIDSGYIADALAAAGTEKIRLRFSAHGDPPGYYPHPFFLEEIDPEAGPEWLSVIQPMGHDDSPLSRLLVAEWEQVSGRAWEWRKAPTAAEVVGSGEENEVAEDSEEQGEAAPDENDYARRRQELTAATA